MRVLLLGCALWCCTLAAQDACPAVFRVAYNNSWLPYVELTDEKVTGSDIELLRSLVQQLGSSVQLVRMSEQRALQQLQQGELDLLIAASYTEDRSRYAYFSIPYREEHITAVVNKTVLAAQPELKTSSDFYHLASKHWSGAVNTAGYYGDEFEHFKHDEGKDRLFHVAEEFRRLQMVAQGRAQYSVVDQKVAHYHISRHQELAELQLLPFLLHKSSIHLMLSHKTISESCVKKLDLQLKKLLKTRTASEQ